MCKITKKQQRITTLERLDSIQAAVAIAKREFKKNHIAKAKKQINIICLDANSAERWIEGLQSKSPLQQHFPRNRQHVIGPCVPSLLPGVSVNPGVNQMSIKECLLAALIAWTIATIIVWGAIVMYYMNTLQVNHIDESVFHTVTKNHTVTRLLMVGRNIVPRALLSGRLYNSRMTAATGSGAPCFYPSVNIHLFLQLVSHTSACAPTILSRLLYSNRHYIIVIILNGTCHVLIILCVICY